MMTNKLPFSRFKQFIEKNEPFSKVYINMYCLIELYRNKVAQLNAQTQSMYYVDLESDLPYKEAQI